MKVFTCAHCGQRVYFENFTCTRCGSDLGFEPGALEMRTSPAGAGDGFAGSGGPRWSRCANAAAAGCNWLVPEEGTGGFCRACALNRTIPDLGDPANAARWREIEAGKRRLVYALLRFDLPVRERDEAAGDGLAFDFLADMPGKPAMTGHEDGLITLSIAEADPAERERRRTDLGEAYRTVLGHLRHEVGHHYWDVLVRDGGKLEACRAVFGDERADYAAALEAHYADGPPSDWQSAFVSSYATSHPWEDFAETWTHYLHIVATLDTARSFGVSVRPEDGSDVRSARIAYDPYRANCIEDLIDDWLPLTYAVNSLNRSMGQPDLYPFVLAAPAIAKLGFIHDLIAPFRRSAT